MKLGSIGRLQGFTLVELAVVVMVLGLLAAAALRYSAMNSDSKNIVKLNSTLDAIDAALLNFRIANGRLPCPANITYAENTATFGQEVDTTGDGLCTGSNFNNSTLTQAVAGGVPTKTLQLADKYAYDPWGRKILYAVDMRITASGAFTTYPIYSTTIGAIIIKKTSTDVLANAITTTGIYALVSSGENGHGGYVRSASGTSTPYNASSTNADELQNCHCNSSATPNSNTLFDGIYVQKSKTYDPTSFSDSFDDVVRFKTRSQVTTTAEIQ